MYICMYVSIKFKKKKVKDYLNTTSKLTVSQNGKMKNQILSGSTNSSQKDIELFYAGKVLKESNNTNTNTNTTTNNNNSKVTFDENSTLMKLVKNLTMVDVSSKTKSLSQIIPV